MRYELTDFEWDAITSFLPNKPRGGPNVAYGTAADKRADPMRTSERIWLLAFKLVSKA